jgi:hypothetical protein
MVARAVVQTVTGATLYLSASIPATYDAAGYQASSMVYTEIAAEAESLGNHGGTAAVTQRKPIKTGVIAKAKGSKDYGTMSMTIGSIPGSAGQILLNAAFESNAHYSAKLLYADGEEHYMDVLVTKFEYQDGAADDNSNIGVDLALSRAPVVVAAPAA